MTSVVKKCLEETTTNCAQIFKNQRINVNFLLKKELKHMMSTRFRTNIDVIRMVAKLFFSKSLSVNVHEHQSVAPESINAE